MVHRKVVRAHWAAVWCMPSDTGMEQLANNIFANVCAEFFNDMYI
jgi:hypothetical protein